MTWLKRTEGVSSSWGTAPRFGNAVNGNILSHAKYTQKAHPLLLASRLAWSPQWGVNRHKLLAVSCNPIAAAMKHKHETNTGLISKTKSVTSAKQYAHALDRTLTDGNSRGINLLQERQQPSRAGLSCQEQWRRGPTYWDHGKARKAASMSW